MIREIFEMNDTELLVAVFGEGIPPGAEPEVRDIQEKITVSMNSEKIQFPFGNVDTKPFLELFWRKTGADCTDEEEEMKLPDGKTYLIKLCD